MELARERERYRRIMGAFVSGLLLVACGGALVACGGADERTHVDSSDMCPGEAPMVAAYDRESGEDRWQACGDPMRFNLLRSATDDVVTVSDAGGGVIRLDASTGERLETEDATEISADPPGDVARPSTSSANDAGVRLSGGQDDPLVAVDAAGGGELWRQPDDHLPYDDVWAVGDGAVYVLHFVGPSPTGTPAPVRAYELRTGEIRWEQPAAAYPWWVDDGQVFAIWKNLTVMSTETGEVVWATDYSGGEFPGMRGVLANNDTVFVSFTMHYGGGD